MDDESRAFYRLAVQQAEAMYGMVAEHPLFFEWVQDPVQMVARFKEEGDRLFQIWMWCYLLLQAFAVVCACLYFSKEERSLMGVFELGHASGACTKVGNKASQ
eukprot:6060362-Amphidinium_carterae.2